MTGSTSGPRVPGTTLLKIARVLFSEHLLSTVVQPTISDLQREMAHAGSHRLKRLRAQWRGYCAFWTVMLVAPFASRSSPAEVAGAVAFPDATVRLAVGSIIVTLLVIAGPLPSAGVAVVTAVGTLFAILIHARTDRHPSDIPDSDRTTAALAANQLLLHGSRRQHWRAHLRGGQRLHRGPRPAVCDLVPVRRDGRRVCSRVGAGRLAYEPPEVRPAGESDCVALTGVRAARAWTMSMLCEAVVFLLLAFPAVAQAQAFEVISIKPARSGDPRDMRLRVLPTVISMRARCLCSCC